MMNMKLTQYPPLESQRLNFRILTHENAKEVFQHFSDKDVTRFMDIEPCKDIKEAEEIIQFHTDDAGCRWGLYVKNTQSFIGTIGFHYLRSNPEFIAEIGFDLTKDFWGKGYMSEAMTEVINFGFNQMELEIIDATVDPNNEKSLNLMRKLGFNEDLELRDNLVYFYLSNKDMADNV